MVTREEGEGAPIVPSSTAFLAERLEAMPKQMTRGTCSLQGCTKWGVAVCQQLQDMAEIFPGGAGGVRVR